MQARRHPGRAGPIRREIQARASGVGRVPLAGRAPIRLGCRKPCTYAASQRSQGDSAAPSTSHAPGAGQPPQVAQAVQPELRRLG